jgi:hypothetical protein
MPNKEYGKPLRQDSVSAPLLSWDIFMEGYWKKMSLAEDKLKLDKMARLHLWQQQWNIETLLLKQGKVIVVTDPFLHIVFASSNITAMNGYTVAEITGKTPKLFQGENTDKNIIIDIRNAIRERRNFHVSLINYKKNKEPYHCNIEGFPVFNKKKQLVNFIAFETPEYYDY